MAYNFKSIADVEVVAEPTESANVLIEENGIIKKAPKTAVGGYYIFHEDGAVVTATDGIYDAIVENLFTNVTGITVKAFHIDKSDVFNRIIEFTVENFVYDPKNEQIEVGCSDGMTFFLHKNGKHSSYWD